MFHVDLGWLVNGTLKPHESYYATPIPSSQVRSSPQLDFKNLIDAATEFSEEANLTHFLSFKVETSNSSTKEMSSAIANTHTLDKSESFMDTAVLLGRAAKKWLERTIFVERTKGLPGCRVSISSGCYNSAQERHESQRRRQYSGAPLAAVTEGLESLAIGDIRDLGVQGDVRKTRGNEISFLAPGGRVYGVEYRRVEFYWYRREDIDVATLEQKSRWELTGGSRDLRAEDDTETIVEAHLTEDLFERANGLGLEKEQEAGDNDEEEVSYVTLTLGADKYFLNV